MRGARIIAGVVLALFAPTAALCAFGNDPGGMFTTPAKIQSPSSVAVNPGLLAPATEPVMAEKDPPVLLGADEMGYDQQNGIVIARGSVEVEQGSTVLLADQVTYFQRSDTVVAEGNVSILQASGDVVFSNKVKLHNSLKTGLIDAFKARLSDDSVLVAARAERAGPVSTKLVQAEYTPCNVCVGKAPFWQLNADEIELNNLDNSVTYHDATMNIAGVPVFYTPYASHPTPDAPAKSGFLPSQYGNNTNIGAFVKVPYYWRIDHDKELTLTPWYTTQEGLLLQGMYHQQRDTGMFDIQGSATNPEQLDSAGKAIGGNQFRGHLFAKGEEPISDNSRIGFDINRTSDDTFLRRYALGDQRVLFSRLYGETANGRNYARVQGLAIQGLRATDNSDTTPLMLPMIQGFYETTPDDHGIRYHVAGDTQFLSRNVGVDQRRVSATVGASVPYITDGGQIITSTLNLRQDVYQTQNQLGVSDPDTTTARTIPQAAVELRYPLIQQMGNDSVTIEPMALAVMQPNGNNPTTISNEDSRLLELTDTNLFSINRMPGLDKVDSGTRVAYGARAQYLFDRGTSIDALLGQNYNPQSDTPFPNSTKPGEDFSDYIGRVAFSYAPFNIAYRFALDNEQLNFNRNEFALGFAKPWLNVSSSFRSIRNNRFVSDSEEGDVAATLPLSDNWTIFGSARRNFTANQLVTASSGIVFKNECFNIGLDVVRNFASDRDVEPVTQFLLRVAFKNLGEFGGQ